MKNFLMKFADVGLEKHYQCQRNEKLQKPLFYSFMIVSLVINISSFISQIANNLKQIPISIVGCISAPIILWLGIKYKNINITLPVYLLTFDPSKQTCDEYFSFGFSLSIFSTVILFIGDFYIGVLQVIINIISIQAITAYISQRIDYMNVFIGIAAIIQLIHTIYKFDECSRSQFLMNEKESLFLKQSKFFIQKPHFLVQINEKTKQINVTYMQQFKELNYQKLGYCIGCFGRCFLRQCISQNTNTSLEEVLFCPKLQKLNQTHQIRYGKFNLYVKVLEYGYHDRFVIIIESGMQDKLYETKLSPETIHLLTNYFLTLNNSFKNNRMIKIGMMSILLIDTYQVKFVNLTKLFKRLIKEFELEDIIQMTFYKNANKRLNCNCAIKVQTFYYQLIIFIIQILLTSQEISKSGEKIVFNLLDFEEFIELQIKLQHNQDYYKLLTKNLFIQTLSDTLLYDNINNNLQIKFRKDQQFSTKSIQIVTH